MTIAVVKELGFAYFIKLQDIPKEPGVYFFSNENNEVVYVGKAKNLRNRVRSYTDPNSSVKVKEIVNNSNQISYIVCPDENYALILESQFIVREKPKYNIKLKNTQGYPRIHITKETDTFPSMLKVSWKDGADHYGPYPAVKADKIVGSLVTAFPVRTCSDSVYKKHYAARKMCEIGELGKCVGPCIGGASKSLNTNNIVKIRNFLEGNDDSKTLDKLNDSMTAYAASENFEKALILRDSLAVLKEVHENTQKTEITGTAVIVSVTHEEKGFHGFSVVKVRKGKILAVHRNIFERKGLSNYDTLSQLISVVSYEYGAHHFENRIIIDFPFRLEGGEYRALKDNLKKFYLRLSKANRNFHTINNLARKNAKEALQENKESLEKQITALRELKEILGLAKTPYRIEGYDISHINGKFPYGSVVVYEGASYTRYQDRVVSIPKEYAHNDLQSLKYVLQKRLQPKFLGYDTLPDVVIIDGGLEQYKIAQSLVTSLGVDIKVVSLAKKMEELYIDNSGDSLILSRNSSSLKLIQSVRDSSHNLAIRKHREKRDNYM